MDDCLCKKNEEPNNPKEAEPPIQTVPYIVYESAVAAHERSMKKLIISLIISILLIFGTNISWLYYISTYDFQSYEVHSDNTGNANFIWNDGDIINGSKSERESQNEAK